MEAVIDFCNLFLKPGAGKRKFWSWMLENFQLAVLSSLGSLEPETFRNCFIAVTGFAVLGYMAEYSEGSPAGNEGFTLRKYRILLVGTFTLCLLLGFGFITQDVFRDCYIGLSGAVIVGYMKEYQKK